jgi:hypothetical protein
MRYFKKTFYILIVFAVFLASISPFYFCIDEASKGIAAKNQAIQALAKAIGAKSVNDVVICDSRTDEALAADNLNKKTNHNKKRACDCQFANQKNNFNEFVKGAPEALFLSQEVKFFANQQLILAANIYSPSTPRSPPFFA